MNHWQRTFAFATACLVIGLAIVVFTHNFFKFVNEPGTRGYLTLFGFGLVFLNLGFAINRRFMLKSEPAPALNYLFSFLTAAPTLLWIFTKDEGLGDSIFTFTATILFAAFLGTFFGIRRGRAKKIAYLDQQRKEDEDELPENLRRSHEKLNKN